MSNKTLRTPRNKKPYKSPELNPWTSPLPITNEGYKFKGVFNGYTVIVANVDEMSHLNSMGNFGKGNISRNHPVYNKTHTRFMRERQFNNRKHWKSDLQTTASDSTKVVVTPDSGDELDYFIDLKPRIDYDLSGFTENLHLSLEEAFFLLHDLQVLIIDDDVTKQTLSSESVWQLFQTIDRNFIFNYTVYFYYRAKNWVVRPGIKFGGDFLLYKQGPIYFHASYVVIIDVINENFDRKIESSRRSMDIKHLLGLNRLCETTGKELLICQLIIKEDDPIINPQDIAKVTIKDMIMKRWLLKEGANE